MGAVYKDKRACCKMCKPYKRGFEPKRSAKERYLAKVAQQQVREVLVERN